MRHVDEIVVVDTGSTDRSVDIARSWGAEVHEQPWRRDFSFHRNHALSLARGEWALVIDGDEDLRRGESLRETVERANADPEADGVSVWLDAVDGATVLEQAVAVRAFRRSVGRYRQPVHNQLVGVTRVTPSRAAIRSHYGGTMEAKATRSVPMLREMLAADPGSRHARYFLAKTAFALHDFATCGRLCAELLADSPAEPQMAPVWHWAAYSALATVDNTMDEKGIVAVAGVR